jgi:photosystem II stability/assembly factor-like uncharacterized protein
MAAVLVMAVAVAYPGGTAAAAQAGGAWQNLGLKGYTYRLLTPPSGALFAQQVGGVFRSDDAGATWARVNLPPRGAPPNAGLVFTLDPTNHTIMYANGAQGVYKSINDAASWSLILPTTEVVTSIVVSQADPNMVYLTAGDKPANNATRYRVLRSRDGGASWDELENLLATCQANTLYIQPHPTDGQRVMRQQTCNPGGSVNGALAESRDGGVSWTKLYERAGWRPQRVAGGEGAMPQRFFMNLMQSPSGTYLLLRSDDDGQNWAETTQPWASLALPAETERLVIGGVDTDLTNPNRVYAGVNVHRSNRTPGVQSFLFSRVMVSDDAGASWSDTGFGGEVVIIDVKLGIDGRNLYASTAEGVWRLPVGSAN